MNNISNELKLAKILEAYIEGEKQIEISRLVLAEKPDFDPFVVFKKIDRHGIGYVTANDLLKFLRYPNFFLNKLI